MNQLLIIITILIFSAFFSGMEIAFITSNKLMIELNKKKERFSSRIIEIFMKNPARYITTMLIGNNIAMVIYGIIMAKVLGSFIHVSSPTVLLIIQTLISTSLILISAEFLPKTIFRINPNSALNFFSIPTYVFYYLFIPISQFIIWLSNIILKNIFKAKALNELKPYVFGKIDLIHLLNLNTEASTEQVTEENDIRLFQNALHFSNVKLRDCMVPRTEIVAVELNSTVEELNQKFIETGYSKILVYKDTIDNILGYITSKELFKNMNDISSRIIPLSFYPETMPASKLLRELIHERKSLAAVVDEFGGISGILTIEDIIEEIFGEIEDEHDTIELVEKPINKNEFIFSGRLEIDYLNEKYNLGIPESDQYETLAGFIFYHYENIPKLNERIVIDNIDFKILKVTKTRIELVYLKITS